MDGGEPLTFALCFLFFAGSLFTRSMFCYIKRKIRKIGKEKNEHKFLKEKKKERRGDVIMDCLMKKVAEGNLILGQSLLLPIQATECSLQSCMCTAQRWSSRQVCPNLGV